MDEKDLHHRLLCPDAYPEKTGSISFLETHISRLYFTDSHVYKIKKPVNLGFLDFTTLEKRFFFCREEVRLNRRFCPDTYLGVIPIRACGGGLRVGGCEGHIIEYAVQMKKLPEERMLDVLLQQKHPSLGREMKRLAAFLAEIHHQAPQSSDVAPDLCDLDSIRSNWRENFLQTEPFAGRTIPCDGLRHCRETLEAMIRTHRELFMQRERLGFVREVHGDLHTEHVCLTEPVKIFDCIEFNRRFRVSDVLSDLAFLLMDLDFRDRRDLSQQLLTAYLRRSAVHDGQDILLPFYKVYRAWVRGKVESITMSQHPSSDATHHRTKDLARRYFNLAMGYLTAPFLLITSGLMGSGKSVLCQSLARATGATLIQSDVVRKNLRGISLWEHVRVPFESGIYTPEMTEKTYAELVARASRELRNRKSVIVDATFSQAKHRLEMRRLAADHAVFFLIVHVVCDDRIHRQRLTQREKKGGSVSDGRLALLAEQAAKFEKVEENPQTVQVDSSREVEYNAGLVLTRLMKHST